ncbi:biosynthetic-type acetolactate synthase large subunit [Suttonella sp. R2A3]|uniref:biosynthetic-type acetolactate synthase large subunit n=1 Tax=Suttonella sp. R2A3 TaxID=2908648 RepID=UPI001F2C119F|nr:biosynthetic-type acetolactate synthase large subunit [Suttonella sp. R2A3]UJF24420.1 biosynthetic-type acetolactate synthase large subunit [Suttonella sp. R2A3]
MATRKHRLNGAEIIIEALKAEGTEYIFGYPGGAVLHIYDVLFKQNDIVHVLARHEQGAVHAADGYARASGKVGVALMTSGPGLTNAVTGIATAYADSIPMVVFSGQVPSSLIGNDAFQEVDAVGITRPCVKHSYLVKDVRKLAETIKKAFYIASTGRPGPVLIDVPKDVTAAETPFFYSDEVHIPSYQPTVDGHIGQIKKALKLLKRAKRPMLYSGGGVVIDNASDEMTTLARRLHLPVTNTLMGLGAYPANDPQFVGMLGMHGTYEANMAMHHCDVLFAIGARFDDRVTGLLEKFCPKAQIIHIDIDPSSIAKNVQVDIPIVGSVKSVLSEMLRLTEDKTFDEAQVAPWWSQIDQWRAIECLDFEQTDEVIKPQRVIKTLYELTGGKAIITSDVGQHQMWAAQYYGFHEPRRWINSGGLGTMGFGYPAALGAKLARPDEDVYCITGEGSIQMMLQEMTTALQYNIPTKIICLNNGYLGMVRQWQEFFYDRRYSMSYMDALPDFAKLAEGYGHRGINIEHASELEDKLREVIAMKDETVFVNIKTDPRENVFPMIPSGGGQADMLLAGRDKMKSVFNEGMVLV